MKKISTWIITVFLGATLALAQNTGGDKKLNPQPLPPGKKATAATTTTKKSHKGGKKGKSTESHKGGKKATKKGPETTPPPK